MAEPIHIAVEPTDPPDYSISSPMAGHTRIEFGFRSHSPNWEISTSFGGHEYQVEAASIPEVLELLANAIRANLLDDHSRSVAAELALP